MGNQNDKNDWLTLALIPGVGTTQFIRLLDLARDGTAELFAHQRKALGIK